jgi:pyruvate dehydrogenase E2 component (dihydrolipoamide acetyltransferase)
MKIEIVMPQMGESITEGTLIKWHKKKGELVAKDEIIYEISTDKVDTEIPSPGDGILLDIKVSEQETVKIGTVVAILETNTESRSATTENEKEETPSTSQVGGELVEVTMPKMGESVMEGIIIKWLKQAGDKVRRDEIILEISTDKVDTEIPSPAEGILSEILYNENDTVNVGTTIAKIITTVGIVKTEPPAYESNIVNNNDGFHQPGIRKEAKKDPNHFYSPLVLNIARTEGIPISKLSEIDGTGTGGRVTKNDLLKYAASRNKSNNKVGIHSDNQKSDIVPDKGEYKTPIIKGEATEIIPMDNNRRRVMEHMIHSRDTSVHVTAVIETDISQIHNYLTKNKNLFAGEGVKLTYMSFISFAVVKALKEFPLMNSSIDGDSIILKKYINLGIAVALEPNGLIVPNIKNADEKSVRGLAKSIADLGARARGKKLLPEDVAGGTFSITNYGVFGSLFGTPIINQPESGILGVGAVTKKTVVVENNGLDSIAVKPMIYLSISHDHRLIDGMLGGKFLKFVKETLENFDVSTV